MLRWQTRTRMLRNRVWVSACVCVMRVRVCVNAPVCVRARACMYVRVCMCVHVFCFMRVCVPLCVRVLC